MPCDNACGAEQIIAHTSCAECLSVWCDRGTHMKHFQCHDQPWSCHRYSIHVRQTELRQDQTVVVNAHPHGSNCGWPM